MIRIRIEFLEAQLKGDAGTAKIDSDVGDIGKPVFEFTEAEKEAMRKELEVLKAQLAISGK